MYFSGTTHARISASPIQAACVWLARLAVVCGGCSGGSSGGSSGRGGSGQVVVPDLADFRIFVRKTVCA